jgi:hypothetical protein
MSIAGANPVAFSSWGLLATATVSGGWDGSTTATSPAAMVAEILDAEGIGTLGTDLFDSHEPEKPDACITCYDSGGLPPDPKWGYDRPRVHVRVRSAPGDKAGGYTIAKGVKDILLGITPGETVRGITMPGEISHEGQDQSRRHIWNLNFLLMVQPTDAGNRTAL